MRIIKALTLTLLFAAVLALTAICYETIPESEKGDTGDCESSQGYVAEQPEPNYMAEIISALTAGDLDTAEELNRQRNIKIDSLVDCRYPKVDVGDLFLLGKIMTLEAGNCPHDVCPMGIGEIVINRVNSPEWDIPDTVEEVLKAPGQYYYPSLAGMFERALPSERCLKLALRLLEGERHLEPSVIFHSNSVIGSSVHSSYKHEGHSTLYFGFSYNKNLY